ncbi:Aste57867_11556 [Aphanomyces stellatus]|uniref:Aste57867_11556 protein n=1 Tax=Aphanomyces stellatus TaxID=120398 RepID=A0A485KTC8_9STRA|nr:hypothetical protein As57867_011513 [Aphanomyces stellatus]VFT88415.1 Aste57867_11556 [Aphanomyces stellatus]
MGKQAASPTTTGKSTIATSPGTGVDVVALSRGRFLEHLVSYRERLLAQFVEHQSAALKLDEDERRDLRTKIIDVDLHASEEESDEETENLETDEGDDVPATQSDNDDAAEVETDEVDTAADEQDAPPTMLDSERTEDRVDADPATSEPTPSVTPILLSPDRKKRPRAHNQSPTKVQADSTKPTTIRTPPRKVQRSSTPIRQYQSPVISTNMRYMGIPTGFPPSDKPNETPNGADDASTSLVDLIRTHTDKVQQLQKMPSKKRQLPRLKDPCRLKCHWDTLLDEMKWMATDFAEERQWKRAAAWRLARDACEAKSSEKRSQEQDKRKLARLVALQISSYWRAMERIAARYQTRSSSTAFERTASISVKDAASLSPRPRGSDANAGFEWLREGQEALVREKTAQIFEASRSARENLKKNGGGSTDEAYAHLKLAAFQWNALKFMLDMREAGYHLILNDQLGTGKPFTVSLFLYALDHLDTPTEPHLIVVPDAEIHKWVHYVKALHRHGRIQIYGGTPVERRKHQRAWDKEYMASTETNEPPVYCCICPHAVFVEEAATVFASQTWQAVVVEDMGLSVDSPSAYMSIKNTSSRVVVSEMALDQWSSERMALWGEFLLKSVAAEWNLMEWDELNLADAASVQRMMKRAGLPYKDESSCLQIALRSLTLGRLRNDMEAQLGKVEEQTVGCTMTASQLKCYNNVVVGFNSSADKETLDHWLRFMLRLRSACNGVDILQDFERLSVVDRAMLESCSAKLKALMELVNRLVHQDNVRVAIYMQCDMMLPVVEYAVMNHLNIPCVRVTGSTVNQHRALTHFAMKDAVRVAILSSRTRTVGSNRAVCAYGAQAVIVLDSDWDPMCDAKLRASWQLLATNSDVTVYRLYCESSIEASLLRVGSTVSEKLFGEMTPTECIASPQFKFDVCPLWWSTSSNNDMSMALMSAELMEKYCGNVENVEWYQLESPLTTGGELETEEHLLLSNSDELTPVEWYSVHLVQSLKEKQIPRSATKQNQLERASEDDRSSHLSFERLIGERNRTQWKQEATSSLFYEKEASLTSVVENFRLQGMHSTFGVYEPPVVHIEGETLLDTRDDTPFWVTYRARKPPTPVVPPDKAKAIADGKPMKPKKPKIPGKAPLAASDAESLKRKAPSGDVKKSTDYEGMPLPEASSGFDDDGFWGDTNLDALDSVSWDDTSILGGIQVQGLPDPVRTKKLKTDPVVSQKPRNKIAEATREGWSFVEEGLLKKLHDMYGANWNLIAQILTRHAMVKRRSARQCQEKYQRLTMPNKDKPVKPKSLSLSPAAVTSRVGMHTGGVLLKYPNSAFGIPPPPIRKNWILKQPVQDHELRHFRSTMDAVLASVKKKLPSPPIPIPVSVAPHDSHAEILATAILSPDEVINKSKQLAAATYQAANAVPTLTPFPETSGMGSLEIPTTAPATTTSPETPAWGDMSLLHQNLTRAGAESASTLPNANGVPVSTSAFLYVIDRMPEIKNQIQGILHRNDCSENQKVALIARLLSTTNQSSPAAPVNAAASRSLDQALNGEVVMNKPPTTMSPTEL